MGAPDNATNYTDSIALFNYVFNNYSNTTLLSDYEFDAEAATTAQNFLNDYYGCENLGTMHLSVDNNQPFIFANNADRTKLQMNLFHPQTGWMKVISVLWKFPMKVRPA